MPEIVQFLEQNPDFERALFPGVEVRYLMPANNPRPTAEEARILTLWHEAGHAVIATVVAHASCGRVSAEDALRPWAHTPLDRSVPQEQWSVAADLVDLAGLYAEFVALESRHGHGLLHQHLKNAAFDLDGARRRLQFPPKREAAWAAQRGGLALQVVRYYSQAIRDVATALEGGPLNGREVEEIVRRNLPLEPPSQAVAVVLKASFVATASGGS